MGDQGQLGTPPPGPGWQREEGVFPTAGKGVEAAKQTVGGCMCRTVPQTSSSFGSVQGSPGESWSHRAKPNADQGFTPAAEQLAAGEQRGGCPQAGSVMGSQAWQGCQPS